MSNDVAPFDPKFFHFGPVPFEHRLLSTGDTAEWLGHAPEWGARHVRQLCREGELKSVQLGRRRYVIAGSVLEYIERQRERERNGEITVQGSWLKPDASYFNKMAVPST